MGDSALSLDRVGVEECLPPRVNRGVNRESLIEEGLERNGPPPGFLRIPALEEHDIKVG